MTENLIIHVDMDAFYASVELLDNPELRGQCVIVGGASNRGVVCSASYEARKLGVRSAMPIVTARKLCPKGVFLPVRRARYQEISRKVFEIFHQYTPLVEPISLDEAFMDVTSSTRLFGSGEEIAANIRRQIESSLGITASAGIAKNKLVAKIASDLCKPNGLLVVPADKTQDFLDPLPISRLWGVGPASRDKLRSLGVKTIHDVRKLTQEMLSANFGRNGEVIYAFARGMDDRPVEPPGAAKSIGREITFDHNVYTLEEAYKWMLFLSERVARRMRKEEATGRTVNIKVKYADFVQVTRSVTLESPTDDPGEIYTHAKKLLQKTLVGSKAVRLLGVTLSQLVTPGQAWQPGLFDDPTASERKRKLNQALDGIWDRFGSGTVEPAALVTDVAKHNLR
ncbi:DNA polymerase IV [Desulfatibacillum aliphaticivorans]|uniref:DNA polymerase IV n=1 Tax=Desulfatibacillum aliphaticivorans TaxID=218208 RepID=UPI000486685C|nr:DNA polymerase IV [Desulfatibacillum aliphaticivorans]